jgi:small multidrug resistance pump
MKSSATPAWMGYVLYAAAIYNVLWGAWVVLAPNHFFTLANLPLPTYPSIWQCVGMIVGVYGIGYLIAARDPMRHWPIILVGLLGKIFGPIGYAYGAFVEGSLDPAFGWTIPTNDLIWWVPFSLMLYRVWQVHQHHDASAS